MRLEIPIEQAAVKLVKKEFGYDGYKVVVKGVKGFPDRWFFLPEKPLLVEYKRPGKPVYPLQEYRINYLRSLGYEVEVHTSEQETLDSVERILAARR